MNFLNKTWLWVAISLVFSICLTTCASAALLDIFVVKHESDEEVVYESMDFGNSSLNGGSNVSNNTNNTNTQSPSGSSTSKVTDSGGKQTSATSNSSSTSSSNSDSSSSSSGASPSSVLTESEIKALNSAISITKQVGTYDNDKVSLTLTEKVFTSGSNKTTYFVAHIEMTSAEYFKTALASGNSLVINEGETVANLAKSNNAIFAINGDGCGQSHTTGYVVRNGVQYRSSARDSSGETESLVLYANGNMEIIDERTTALSSITNKWQVFSFGPGLINNGSIAVTKNQEISGDKSMNDNPRTAIGMVKPLHYVIIVGNGRTSSSKGLTLYQLAQALAYEGCTIGYNLDGGGSSTMWFNGKVINYPTTNGKYKERDVSDIVYIGA